MKPVARDPCALNTMWESIRKSDNEPFVCDLGLGHGVTHSKYTSSGKRNVIPKWAPPESFGPGYVATYEGDVWSLACVLLELFTGYRLWQNIVGNKLGQVLSMNEVLARFFHGNVTPNILSLVDIAAVRNALQSCFTKEKEKRPSAKDLTEIFEGALLSVNE
ncbi:serine/threonine-protein kinase BCK1/SLK1/SSP31-like [Strongylocentrotus purpuratus]|uniref:Protein kinase domain-containing protein n=1 Tax=Strongylocentrotus purpuratus TaxID=7668 RepID=A0A7M7PC14_STRPU|nr:serine/threonine-protein kinase BCK1/SLK1/SSP31-like [Strongylocentrotus purpuratus]